MLENFWHKLNKPIFALAPMADVTDPAFRRIITKHGKPDVIWTEFVSADGLALAPEEGRKKLLKDLEFSESERPIVAQFFTSRLENMEKASRLAQELGFDGVDINMGCPDKGVEKQGAGASLIKNPKLARELIRSAKIGAPSLPISVKTRVGYNQPNLDEWVKELLSEDLSALTIHARTRKEMSKVPARWEFIRRAVEVRDEMDVKTLILGNGDVEDLEEAQKRIEETSCDGVMFGRAIFGNPWLFANLGQYRNSSEIHGEIRTISLEERLSVLVEHTKLFNDLLGGCKSFTLMKKHFKAYLSGKALATSDIKDFDRASEIRARLMEAETAQEVTQIVDSIDFSKTS